MAARSDSVAQLVAPSLDEMALIADEAFRSLPGDFHALCGELVIRIEDFPDEEVLEDMDCDTDYDLLGLFTGTGLAQMSPSSPALMPNIIFLYRRPILDYWAEHEETLGAIVTHVLVHEIGHHFGLSDDDMARIEMAADAEQPGTVQ